MFHNPDTTIILIQKENRIASENNDLDAKDMILKAFNRRRYKKVLVQ
jgi:hypothetical protein